MIYNLFLNIEAFLLLHLLPFLLAVQFSPFPYYEHQAKESRGRYSYLTPERTKPITARKLGTDFDKTAINAPKPNTIQNMVDIQKKLSEGKGTGYEKWAKIHNLKQAAKTVNFLSEHGFAIAISVSPFLQNRVGEIFSPLSHHQYMPFGIRQFNLTSNHSSPISTLTKKATQDNADAV